LLSEAGPPGRLPAAKTMEAKSLSRAQRSRLARKRATRESGLGLDGEHGSGTADLADRDRRSVTPFGRRPRQTQSASLGDGWAEADAVSDRVYKTPTAFGLQRAA
jgi:hypothetical protein